MKRDMIQGRACKKTERGECQHASGAFGPGADILLAAQVSHRMGALGPGRHLLGEKSLVNWLIEYLSGVPGAQGLGPNGRLWRALRSTFGSPLPRFR